MAILANVKIGTRVLVGFALTTAITVVLAVLAAVQIRSVGGAMGRSEHEHAKTRQAALVENDVDSLHLNLFDYVLARSAGERAEHRAIIGALREDYRKRLAWLERSAGSEAEKQLVADLEKKFAAGREANLRVSALADAGKSAEAAALLSGQSKERREEIEGALSRLTRHLDGRVADNVRAASGSVATARWVLGGAGLAALVLAALVALSIARFVNRTNADLAGEIDRTAHRVVVGHLDARSNPSAVHFELRPLVDAVNRIVSAFCGHFDNLPNPLLTVD